MNRVSSSFWLFAAATATFAAAAVHGTSLQATPSPPAASQFKNLKVLPIEIPRDRLMAVMKNYATSLGVRCTHCHVGTDGRPETMDFASDARREKMVARSMMTMTRHLNEQEFGIKDFTQSKVTCFTCHRGAIKPLTSVPPPVTPSPSAPKTTERG